MKKLLLIIFSMALLGTVKAQSISYGPKFGLNVTNITNLEGDNKCSFHIGGFAEVKFTDLIGLQLELLYSRQGARSSFDIGDYDDVKTQMRVNYLNIPVLARFHLIDGFCVEAGPQIGLAMNARLRAKEGGTVVKKKLKDLNTLAMDFAFGASYELDMGVMFSARYTLGMTNVFEKDVVETSNKNHVFQLSVGYRFKQ